VNALLDRREELIRSLRYGTVPGWALPDLIRLVERAASARQGRAASGAAAARGRSARIEAAIVQAAGVLPLGQRGVAGLVQRRLERDPGRYGIKVAPCLPTVRKALARMSKDRKSEASEVTLPHASAREGYGASTAM
jgi:hypothetical protein